MAKTNRKNFIIVLFLVLIVALGIGYAAFSSTLNITGTANANGTFKMQFVQDVPGTTDGCKLMSSQGVRTDGANPTGVTISTATTTNDTLTVNVADLAYPGAGAQFRVVIKNEGSVPAKVTNVTPSNITGDGHAIKITGLDAITTSHPTIEAGKTCTFNFTVEWDENEELQDPVNGDSCSFSLQIDYEQDTTAFTGYVNHVDET